MLKYIAAATAIAAFVSPAAAVPLIADSGWYDSLVVAAGRNAEDAPFTFSLVDSAFLRLTDSRIPGAVFAAFDAGNNISITSTFTTDGAAVPIYDTVAWSDLRFSRFSFLLGPGSYSFDVTTQCTIICPAGFGIRLDSAPGIGPGVPEPAGWALLIAGFGLTGAAMRRRRSVVAG